MHYCFLLDVNPASASVEALDAMLAPCGKWQWSQQGERKAQEGKKVGPDDIICPIKFCPRAFKLQEPSHPVLSGGEYLFLQVKESYRLTHPPLEVTEISRETLACWERRLGWCHWNEIHGALQRTVEKFYFLHWIASMQVFLRLFSVPCMHEKSHQIFFF